MSHFEHAIFSLVGLKTIFPCNVDMFTMNKYLGKHIMSDDEYLEITPKSVRLRKKYLTEIDRAKAQRVK